MFKNRNQFGFAHIQLIAVFGIVVLATALTFWRVNKNGSSAHISTDIPLTEIAEDARNAGFIDKDHDLIPLCEEGQTENCESESADDDFDNDDTDDGQDSDIDNDGVENEQDDDDDNDELEDEQEDDSDNDSIDDKDDPDDDNDGEEDDHANEDSHVDEDEQDGSDEDSHADEDN